MKYFLIILSASFFLFSCQKELSFENSSPNNYYIKCKIDGTDHSFIYGSVAAISPVTGTDSSLLSMQGYASSQIDNLEGFGMYIVFANSIIPPQAGVTYKEGTDWPDYQALAQYNPNSETTYYSSGYVSAITPDSLTITINTKTATEISGTFKGAFYKTDTDDSEIHPEFLTISDGEFRLKLQ